MPLSLSKLQRRISNRPFSTKQSIEHQWLKNRTKGSIWNLQNHLFVLGMWLHTFAVFCVLNGVDNWYCQNQPNCWCNTRLDLHRFVQQYNSVYFNETTGKLLKEEFRDGRSTPKKTPDKVAPLMKEGISGRKCFSWETAYFFTGDETYSQFIEDNVCRSIPAKFSDRFGPGCYVSNDPNSITWEPCFPTCEDEKRTCYWRHELPLHVSDLAYLGRKNITDSGVQCINWATDNTSVPYNLCAVKPRQVTLNSDDECRAHSSDEHYRPFCRTGPNKWQFCHKLCEDSNNCFNRTFIGRSTYSGCHERSINGHMCQTWSAHPKYINHPGHKEDIKNFCRNYDHYPSGPYCIVNVNYTVYREPCFQHCEDINEDNHLCVDLSKLVQYAGTKRRTRSGKQCRRWDQIGGQSSYLLDVPQLWMVTNFCRNPDASTEGPWCYISPNEKESCFETCEKVQIEAESTRDWIANITALNQVLLNREEVAKQNRLDRESVSQSVKVPLIIISCFFVICMWYLCSAKVDMFLIKYTPLLRQYAEGKEQLINIMPGSYTDDSGKKQRYDPSKKELQKWKQIQIILLEIKNYMKYNKNADLVEIEKLEEMMDEKKLTEMAIELPQRFKRKHEFKKQGSEKSKLTTITRSEMDDDGDETMDLEESTTIAESTIVSKKAPVKPAKMKAEPLKKDANAAKPKTGRAKIKK